MRDFYKELAEYLKRDETLVRARCRYAYVELAWLWERYKEDPLAFYRETDLYLFDLTQYQTDLQERGWHRWLECILKGSPSIKKVLDFGGGIGEYSIIAAQVGLDVSYLEVKGSQTMAYAQYRFEKYHVHPRILTENDPLETYDLVIAKDVFEHMEDAQAALKKIAEKTTYLLCQIEGLPYNQFYPQHISYPNPSAYFDQLQTDNELWKSKLFHETT